MDWNIKNEGVSEGSMNERTNEWMNEWTNERTNERMNERMNERTNERMNEWVKEWKVKWRSETEWFLKSERESPSYCLSDKSTGGRHRHGNHNALQPVQCFVARETIDGFINYN